MFVILTGILAFALVSAETTNPWSAGSNGEEKNEFTTSQEVYVKSTKLCEPFTEVNLYITENKGLWLSGDDLVDMRGTSDIIILSNYNIPLTRIWSNPSVGEYDLAVDCNQNGKYDLGIDKIDSFDDLGFKVTAIAGTASALKSKQDVGNHSWSYDPEEPNLNNKMLQLSLLARGENVELDNLTIRASGTGNDLEIAGIIVYAGSLMIGSLEPAFSGDNGVSVVSLDYTLEKDVEIDISIIYEMKDTTTEGEFALIVESISGTGEISKKNIKLSGLPILSGKKIVFPKKSCLGILNLELTPNPAQKGANVLAKITGLDGCKDKEIVLRLNPCGSSLQEKISSCVVGENGQGCEMQFTSSTSKTYHACIDKNKDNDYIDFGEYDFEDLVIFVQEPEETNITGTNITQEINITEQNETGTITGGIIVELQEKISSAGSLFILLEITLLLILFVLVMIMFRLRPMRMRKTNNKTKEE